MLFFFFLAMLSGLFVLSRWVTQKLYVFFYVISNNRAIAISLTTLILFPGTVIHELSHLFTAEVLGVRTGKLTLVPESLEENEIRSGSVMIAQSDPFRRYIIGFAPILVGTVVLTAVSFISSPSPYLLFLTSYLLFAVSNTMFSSAQDLKGFIPFAIVLFLLIAAGYAAGIRIGITKQLSDQIERVFTILVQNLGMILGFNVFLLLVLQVCIDITRKIKGYR